MSNKIVAGDYEGGQILLSLGTLTLIHKNVKGSIFLDKNYLKSVEIVTEENKKKFIGTAGWAIAGTALLGPIGLIAGALAGGRKKEILVACQLKDGKKFLAVVNSKVYQKMMQIVF